MSNIKVVKKGETLFKEGDKIQSIHLVQSGSFSLCFIRPKKNIEFFQVPAGQILGDPGLNGQSSYPYTAIATSEAKVLEVPLDGFKQPLETLPQPVKILIKSLLDRNKIAVGELKSFKMEKDASPCPEDLVAKIYGAIYHTAHHKGKSENEKEPHKISLDWSLMRQYAQRVFGEGAKRIENAICVLIKLKLAQFEMGKPPEDPEGPDEIRRVHFLDLPALESFVEFYQYYYFKSGKGEILKVDETCSNILNGLLNASVGVEPDRYKVITLDYQKAVEKVKEDTSINLNSDHFTRLEMKGIFVKRASRSDGQVVIQFDLKELQTTQKIWRILREIDKWNERGFVDMSEDETKAKKKASGPACPECGTAIQASSKFCSECGHKIAA